MRVQVIEHQAGGCTVNIDGVMYTGTMQRGKRIAGARMSLTAEVEEAGGVAAAAEPAAADVVEGAEAEAE